MVELELVGLHSDGEHLTLAGPDGQRYQLLVDDALRAAVRRDRPQLEQIRAAVVLRPKEIQARIRAGATAQEVAEAAGLPVEHVQRYEGPVVAERNWVVEQALRFTIGRAEDSPQLGDLVVDRLAARGVRAGELSWDAVRREDSPWELVARFTAGDKQRTASWEVDTRARTAHALDDEGRWLSETEVAPAPPAARRHLIPVRPYDVEADGDLGPALAAVDADLDRSASGSEPVEDELPFGDLPAATTDELLAELRASRGTRHELDLGPEPEEPEWDLPPAAHPPASASPQDARVFPLPRSAPSAPQTTSSDEATPSRGEATESRPPSAESAPRADSTPAKDSAPRAGGRRTSGREATGGEPARPTSRESSGKPGEDAAKESRRRPSRGRRASVPSWDEIVFGAKPD